MRKFILAMLSAGLFVACGSEQKPADEGSNKLLGIPEIDAFTQKIIKAPNDTALHHARAKAALQMEEYPLALSDAEFLVRTDSTNVVYYRLLADVYFESQQIDAAIQTMELTARKFPKDIYSQLSLAELYFINQKSDKSLLVIDEILKINPYNTDAMFLRGQVFEQKFDTVQALAAFQEVVQQDAEHLGAYLHLAELNDALNNPLAIKYLDNALRIDSVNLTALQKKALYYHKRGQYAPAMEWYEKGTVAHPLNADIAYNKGLLLLDEAERTKNKSLWEKAYKSFDLAAKNDPQFGESYYYRGFCSENMGDIDAAKRDYENAVAFNEKFGYARAALQRLK